MVRKLLEEQERRNREWETTKNRLIKESESQEQSLITRVKELEQEVATLKKGSKVSAIKKANNEALENELEQLKTKEKNLVTELRDVKTKEIRASQEKRELEAIVSSLEERLSKLRAVEAECESLQELNLSLREEAETLEERLQESIAERQLAEQHTSQIFNTLREERESKHKLEEQLGEMEADLTAMRLGLNSPSENVSSRSNSCETEMEETVAVGQSLCDELQKSLDINPSHVLQLENEVAALKENNKTLKVQTDKLKRELAENRRIIEKLQGEKANALKDLDAARRVTDAEALCGQLKAERELAELRHAHVTLQTSSAEEIRFLKGKIESLNEREQKLKAAIATRESEASTLNVKVESLQGGMRDMEMISSVQAASMEKEVTRLRESCAEQTDVITSLQDQLVLKGKSLQDSETGLKETRKDMTTMNEELSALCHYIRVLNGDEDKTGDMANGKDDSDGLQIPTDATLATCCLQLAARAKVQTRSLQQAVERTVQQALERSRGTENDATSSHMAELEKRVGQLQRQLSSKKEEIATLKVVLRMSKSMTETNFFHATSRFEDEKRALQREIDILRADMQVMIQRESEFNVLRSVFANRCDEYVSQLADMQHQMKAAEEEKATLETMLSQAIKQKLAARQKLEEYEIERERLYNIPRKLPSSRI